MYGGVLGGDECELLCIYNIDFYMAKHIFVHIIGTKYKTNDITLPFWFGTFLHFFVCFKRHKVQVRR